MAWVAPVRRADGTAAVLKLGVPHMEAEHEADGLRFWNGRPTVRLLDADAELGALLLEKCEPGTHLRARPEDEQDLVLAGLLRELWRAPDPQDPFRPLTEMVDHWIEDTEEGHAGWVDEGLVREGIRTFRQLAAEPVAAVVLATDLHAGNVLRARRKPWLVIDPKPFVGDPTYDATQHLLNCEGRLRADPAGAIERFTDLLEVDASRVRRWLFARAAAESDAWGEDQIGLARALAP